MLVVVLCAALFIYIRIMIWCLTFFSSFMSYTQYLLHPSEQTDIDESTKNAVKDTLLAYDRTLLVADPRRCEPKKYGGKGARSKKQKSYR